jgi:hypothetical protein
MPKFELPLRIDKRYGKEPPNKIQYPAKCLRCPTILAERPSWRHRLCPECRSRDSKAWRKRHKSRLKFNNRRYYHQVRKPREAARREARKNLLIEWHKTGDGLDIHEARELIDYLLKDRKKYRYG